MPVHFASIDYTNKYVTTSGTVWEKNCLTTLIVKITKIFGMKMFDRKAVAEAFVNSMQRRGESANLISSSTPENGKELQQTVRLVSKSLRRLENSGDFHSLKLRLLCDRNERILNEYQDFYYEGMDGFFAFKRHWD